MALKYSADFLLFLRDSPLCTKPDNLPPAEEWMGPPPEQQPRSQHQQNRSGHNAAFGAFEKPRNGENPLLDQTNRRSGADRHVSRNSATNPDDIVFGPPRMAFASSGRGGSKTLENEKATKDGDRFNNLRNRNGDIDGDRFRESRNANPLNRRGPSGEDSEGWSTVKPRKSFGAEGAERFHGRMGGNFRDEKRAPRERDDRSGRPFDAFTRDRDGDDEGRPRNNGMNRGKTDSWHKTEGSEGRVPEKRERMDRAKSWRERDPEVDTTNDPSSNKYSDNRRWGGREQRAEREPEWLDEPVEPKTEARTQQDFQKWLEDMKKGSQGNAAKLAAAPEPEPPADTVKPSIRSPPAVEQGPDKFFMAFGGKASLDTPTPGEPKEAIKAKPAGKSSRFTSFFQGQDGGKPEPVTPMATAPPNGPNGPPPPNGAANPLLGGFSGGGGQGPEDEKQAFQQLLAKLQKQTMSATPPAHSPFAAPSQGTPVEAGPKYTPSPFQHLQGERGNGPLGRPPPQHPQEILAPRPQQQSARPEQLLQDLVGHHQRVSSQGSARGDLGGASRNNSNTEFLMNLMRSGPDTQRSDSAMLRAAQQAQKQGPMPPQPHDREPDFGQDLRNPPRQMRPGPPPGFPMDDSFRSPGEGDYRQNQPTQILQRPLPPPGLEQMSPAWMGGAQMPPPPQQQPPQQQQTPQQRGPMIPPPGLAGGPGRNAPMPHMFPPNMPPMPHPDAMGNMPPRNMGPPPPGFFNGPPHGFMPPGMAGFNGPPGPEPPFAGSPFEARGMPPSAGGRGANFGR